MYRHTDKQHIHYHIISSRVDVRSGKAISSELRGITDEDRAGSACAIIRIPGRQRERINVSNKNQGLIREIDQVVQKSCLKINHTACIGFAKRAKNED